MHGHPSVAPHTLKTREKGTAWCETRFFNQSINQSINRILMIALRRLRPTGCPLKLVGSDETSDQLLLARDPPPHRGAPDDTTVHRRQRLMSQAPGPVYFPTAATITRRLDSSVFEPLNQ